MRNNQQGFSLLEIMVAFTILAISIGVLMQAFSGGVSLLSNAADQGRVVSLARSQWARVGSEWPVKEGSHAGQWQKFHWQVRLEPYSTGDSVSTIATNKLLQVTIVVNWRDRGNERSYTLKTLRFAPSS